MTKPVKLFNVNLKNVSPEYEWYTIVTAFNYENKVANGIEILQQKYNMFDKIYVPREFKIVEKIDKNGNITENIKIVPGAYAGYVFVKAKMNEAIWNALRAVSGVSLIMTCAGAPVTVSNDDITAIRNKIRSNFSSKWLEKINDLEYYKEFKHENILFSAI